MNQKPDTIKVSASHKQEIPASRADLSVTERGSSLVSGDAAMKKAKEVTQLVEALTRPALSGGEGFGLNPEAIQLQGVHIESSSGALLKSSSATYRLKIQGEDLNQLADLLDILSSQKNAALERIAWKYREDEARENALMTAIEKAKKKAGRAAAAPGVKLLGVYDLIEHVYDEETPYPAFAAQAAPMRAPGRAAPEPGLRMDIQHSKTIRVGVDLWFRVSALDS
jgi:uncharacterized protein YggE